MVILTIRVIRSFEYRTVKNLILKEVDMHITVGQLKELVQATLKANAGLRPYHNNNFDTMKLYVKAHESKTTNLVINLGDEEKILDDSRTLAECGLEDETEISYFNRELYNEYLKNPTVKW